MKHQKGWYIPADEPPKAGRAALVCALQTLHKDVAVVRHNDEVCVVQGGAYFSQTEKPSEQALPVFAHVPALLPNQLGHPSFQERYGVRANYVAGAMANGIASEALVIEMAKAGLMGFFGAAGLPTSRIAQAIDTIEAAIGQLPYGVNLIHSPQVPQQEWESVALFLERGGNEALRRSPRAQDLVEAPPPDHRGARAGADDRRLVHRDAALARRGRHRRRHTHQAGEEGQATAALQGADAQRRLHYHGVRRVGAD